MVMIYMWITDVTYIFLMLFNNAEMIAFKI